MAILKLGNTPTPVVHVVNIELSIWLHLCYRLVNVLVTRVPLHLLNNEFPVFGKCAREGVAFLVPEVFFGVLGVTTAEEVQELSVPRVLLELLHESRVTH